MQRGQFAGVVAQLEGAPVLAHAPGGVRHDHAHADVIALDREPVLRGSFVGAGPEAFGDLAEVDRAADALRRGARAGGDRFEVDVGGLDARRVLQFPFV